MTAPCARLHAYVDGELSDDDRFAFEVHLATCDACAAELPRLLAVVSALEAAARLAAVPRLSLVPGPEPAAQLSAAPAPARRRHRRSIWPAASAIGAVAAGIALLVLPTSAPVAPPVVASLSDQLGPTRHIEARLSYTGTEHYRPLDVARGAQSNEAISIERMGQLEHAKDWHGVAVAALLAGERERAARFFAQAGQAPQVESDRAALELIDGSQQALERALDDVDRALKTAPDQPAALWNRALVLAGLNLPLAAAREFDHVIALNEPGWIDEARRRASALRAEVAQRRTRWKHANDAGNRLIEDGTPVPSDLLAVTGYMTIMLYDAVRAAPSRERVEALLPMAQALDATYHADHLSSYVRRIATSEFRVRKPLADTYRELILHGPLPDAAIDGFLKRLDQTHIDDIWLGAVVRTGRVAANLESYRRRAIATQDPWFAVIAEHETAKAEIARGEFTAAERRVRDAIASAQREQLAYRALSLEETLASLHDHARTLSQVAEVRQIEYREAAAGNEWAFEMNTLAQLAAINQDRYANNLARGYLVELIERTKAPASDPVSASMAAYDCARRQYAYTALAGLSIFELAPVRAREELAEAPPCDDKMSSPRELLLQKDFHLLSALVWAELYRFSHRREDSQIAQQSLAVLGADSSKPPGEQAFIDYIQGLLLIDVDRNSGRKMLRDAISKAGESADDLSIKARAYSFSALALDAGRVADFADVVELVAEALEVARPARPGRCAVAIAAQEGQSAIAVVDARGEISGQFVSSMASPEVDVSRLIPSTVIERLRACDRVVVLARAPVLGAARLFPPEIAWSYLLKGSGAQAVSRAAPRDHRVVVANPVPPPELKLPALAAYPEEPGDPAVLLLRGQAATPTRVLQAMRDASVIEFHTHGFVANDVSESSYLVLSPEADRQYAMTPGDISQVKLEASPLVILGACHAATSSRSLEGGIGLAEAFLRAGARSVIASPDAVQDLTANSFLAAIRERVARGADPAIAVRDERVRHLSVSPHDAWVFGVVVFE